MVLEAFWSRSKLLVWPAENGGESSEETQILAIGAGEGFGKRGARRRETWRLRDTDLAQLLFVCETGAYSWGPWLG